MGSGSRDGIGLKVEQTAMFGSMKRLLDETDKASIQIAPIICLSTKYWPVSGLIKLFRDINVYNPVVYVSCRLLLCHKICCSFIIRLLKRKEFYRN